MRCVWTGFQGAPGVSTFYSLSPVTDTTDLADFFEALTTYLPNTVVIEIPAGGDVIDETTGNLTGAWGGGTSDTVVGTDAGLYAAPAGVRCTWDTNAIMDGHHLRGSTLIVPTAGTAFAQDGTLYTTALGVFEDACSALVGAAGLVIWHRPRAARAADGSRPAVTARAGGYASVEASSVKDQVAILRSRRD